MRRTIVIAVLIATIAAPAAFGQAGVSYQVPPDNPFVGQPGAAAEVYAFGLRNPYRFSFDRQTGDLLIGDVGGGAREEIDWIGALAARGANFGWACREGAVAGPRPDECPVPGAIEPLFDYSQGGSRAVTGGFVVRDPALAGLLGRYLFADFYAGDIRSLALDVANPAHQTTGANVVGISSFGEDAAGRLYAVSLTGSQVFRLVSAGPGQLSTQALGGPFNAPIAVGTFPGDPARLFVAERGGSVRLVVDGSVRPNPFLELAGVSVDGERGLLSVAAAPDYASSGKIYVYYTDAGGDIRVDEFQRSGNDPERADPASRRPVLTIEHSSASNHNGGQLHFGPEGCLWITTGDGGGQNNQFNNAQNLGTLLGKVLRIDPDPPGTGGAVCRWPETPATSPQQNPPPPPASAAAPAVRASVKGRQRVLRLGGVVLYARCLAKRCRLSADGTLRIARQRYPLRQATDTAAAGERVRLKLRLTKRGRKALRTALRRGRRPTVRVVLRVRDETGSLRHVVRDTVRVRR